MNYLAGFLGLAALAAVAGLALIVLLAVICMALAAVDHRGRDQGFPRSRKGRRT